ncbi:unnamed protein product [Brassica oleracea]
MALVTEDLGGIAICLYNRCDYLCIGRPLISLVAFVLLKLYNYYIEMMIDGNFMLTWQGS